MRRSTKQFGIYLSLVLVVGVVRIFFADYDDKLCNLIRQQAQANGLYLVIESCDAELPAQMVLSNVKTIIPNKRVPIPFAFDAIGGKLNWLPLFLLRAQAAIDGLLYGGRLSAIASKPLFGNSVNLSTKLNGLQISEHPLLRSFEVSALTHLNADISVQTKQQPISLKSAKISLNIEDGSYSGNYKIANLVEIPPLEDLSASLAIVGESNFFRITQCKLDSSLGGIEGGGRFSLLNNQLNQVDISLELSLTDVGADKISGYLALAAGLSPDVKTNNWQINIQKSPKDPQPQVLIQVLE